MLVNLHVKNIALIDDTNLDFSEGFNVLTGETGAGKSLIIDSVNFALGAKVPKDIVREDAEYALSELTFVVDELTARKLEDMGVLMEDDQVIMQRRIVNGRGSAKVNGETVTAAFLKEIASLLIDIHGQHEHQSLLYKKKHMEILDEYSGDTLFELKKQLKEKYMCYSKKNNELNEQISSGKNNDRELSFLNYEIEEIKNAHLIPGEDDELEQQYNRMNNSRKLFDTISTVHRLCGYDDADGAGASVGRGIGKLKTACEYDPMVEDLLAQITDIDSLLNDFNRAIADYEQDLVFSQDEYNAVEERLNVLNRLKSKYGLTIEDILSSLESKENELKKYEHFEEYIAELENEVKQLFDECIGLSTKISEIRHNQATNLSKGIEEALIDLNFLDARFEIAVNSYRDNLGINGIDDVEFMISTNPGERLRPLADIASGGELSRIMLALKTVLAEKDNIDTLIFDEIDSGISGRTAQKVSEKIALLSKSHQVICITHLPQIAAMGDANYLIEKTVREGRTVTDVNKLKNESVVNELARMISGAEVTETVLNSAREMKQLADELKHKD